VKRTKAAESFARLSTVLNLLHAHPQGLRVDYLASEVGIPEAMLREELLTYYTADTLSVRPDTLVFISAAGQEEDPGSAEVVKVVSDRPAAELGVELMRPEEWLRAYEVAAWMAEMQPGDRALHEAVEIIGQRILSGSAPRPDSSAGAGISSAIRDHRCLDISYSRAWLPGVVERHVRPLRLVQTGRGWELDALLDDEVRTFLLDRIREVRITDEVFEVPRDIAARLAAHRAVTRLRLNVPQRYEWVVDRYAERSTVLAQDLADVTVEADFLPPVADRVGLILVTAPGAFVIEPNGLNESGPAMARRLWEHHGL